jgi:hypothetical protein
MTNRSNDAQSQSRATHRADIEQADIQSPGPLELSRILEFFRQR